MVDKAAKGRRGEPFELVVERGKIAEFALAVHAQDAEHFRAEAPVSPPTFLTTMFFWEALVEGSNPWDQVKMSQERGMHAEQEYCFFGAPPRAGDRLSCQSRIEDIYEKQGRKGGTLTFAVMITDFHDESGRLVAQARLTGVETERPPEES